MTTAQLIMTYAISWWMVLFMVLPQGAEPEEKPETGHAPSAPARPRLKRKFIITSLLAVLPTVLLYVVIARQAVAEDDIYHAGNGCEPVTAEMREDVKAVDGQGLNGKKVASATLNPSPMLDDMKSVDIPLRIPSEKYLKDKSKYNADLSQSFMDTGKLEIGMNGSANFNGRPASGDDLSSEKCRKKEVAK